MKRQALKGAQGCLVVYNHRHKWLVIEPAVWEEAGEQKAPSHPPHHHTHTPSTGETAVFPSGHGTTTPDQFCIQAAGRQSPDVVCSKKDKCNMCILHQSDRPRGRSTHTNTRARASSGPAPSRLGRCSGLVASAQGHNTLAASLLFGA